ncbi:hypothetical protein [Rheinheimera sp. NSM]|uniref:hypothetical protein n=1 Tax=Rheinheimera sp. NSM TaxID=3457884 RepID=UPI004035E716
MQNREGAEAAAEPQTAQQQTTAKKPMAEQALDQLSELAALSWSVSEHYTEQLKLTGQTAKAEWQLTGRSLTVAAALVVSFGAGLILLWGSILLLLGYLLFQATGSVIIAAIAILLLQSALLLWCWRSLGHVLSQVGFSETWQQLRRVLFAKESPAKQKNHGDNHADR